MLEKTPPATQYIPCNLFWKNNHSIFIGCNERFKKMLGLASTQDIVGRTDYDFHWTKNEADIYRSFDKKVLVSNVELLNFKENHMQVDGSHACLLTSKTQLFDRNNKLIGVCGISQFQSDNTGFSFVNNFKKELCQILNNVNLTIPEVECMSLWVAGHSVQKSSTILKLSVAKIEDLRTQLKCKLELTNVQQLIELLQSKEIFPLFLKCESFLLSNSVCVADSGLPHRELCAVDLLSPKELECIRYLLKGKTIKGIAKELDISPRTAGHYIDKIKDKVGVCYKSELIEKMQEILR